MSAFAVLSPLVRALFALWALLQSRCRVKTIPI